MSLLPILLLLLLPIPLPILLPIPTKAYGKGKKINTLVEDHGKIITELGAQPFSPLVPDTPTTWGQTFNFQSTASWQGTIPVRRKGTIELKMDRW